jgi:hypothetical protein
MSTTDLHEIARQIRDLENSFCNPIKLKLAQELREDYPEAARLADEEHR